MTQIQCTLCRRKK